jgi:hypothetical protein
MKSMKRDQRVPITTIVVIAALVVPARFRLAAQDQPQTTPAPSVNKPAASSYNFLIASGFLCDPPDPDVCPAVANANAGERMEISGAGTLDSAGKSVTGAGAFTEKTANGYLVTTGVWTATQLVSFESYGLDPVALLRDYPQFRRLGPSPLGPRMPGLMMAGPMTGFLGGPMAAGGLAVIRIRLLPDAGSPTEAMLRINCARGKVPDEEQSDGIRLAITSGPAFDEQVSGRTMFLLQRTMPNFAWKRAGVQKGAESRE